MAPAARTHRPARRPAAARPADAGQPPARRGAERPRPRPRTAGRRSPPDRGPVPRDTRGGSTRTSARFTSEVFYDGRLRTRAATSSGSVVHGARATLSRDGVGAAPLEHRRRRRQRVAGGGRGRRRARRGRSCDGGATWTERQRRASRPVDLGRRPDRRAVQRPGRRRSSGALRLPGEARVGTVDKFQGQEAPISIYSMTTSSPGARAARDGLPLQPQPAERGDVAGPLRARSSSRRPTCCASGRGRPSRCASRTRFCRFVEIAGRAPAMRRPTARPRSGRPRRSGRVLAARSADRRRP